MGPDSTEEGSTTRSIPSSSRHCHGRIHSTLRYWYSISAIIYDEQPVWGRQWMNARIRWVTSSRVRVSKGKVGVYFTSWYGVIPSSLAFCSRIRGLHSGCCMAPFFIFSPWDDAPSCTLIMYHPPPRLLAACSVIVYTAACLASEAKTPSVNLS
jgi:hypothetical protein